MTLLISFNESLILSPLIIAAFIAGFFLLFTTLKLLFKPTNRSNHYYAMILGHFGAALLTLSLAFNSAGYQEKEHLLAVGETIDIAGYSLLFDQVEHKQGHNYLTRIGHFILSKDSQPLGWLMPETRYYPVERSQTTEASLYHTIIGDIYIVMAEKNSNNQYGVRVYYKPAMLFLWASILIMAASGLMLVKNSRKNP